MKIVEKIKQKQADLYSRAPITLAFLGDSVTQGCFDCYEIEPNRIETEFYPERAYGELVKRILHKLYPSVPINLVNAGISGSSARGGLDRLERDVLSHSPDLVVVCFGLNDSNNGKKGLKTFYDQLTTIFQKVKESGAECIFMTPNTMNLTVSPKITVKCIKKLAEDFSERMKSGLMDEYVQTAKQAATDAGVTLCDCYALWKRMAESGVNVTELLANKLNHPDREMHFLFAYELVKTMLS